MHAVSLYSDRLRRIHRAFVRADGSIYSADIASSFVEESVGEIFHILDALPADFTDIRARMNADPDLHGIEINRRLSALADWIGIVIGLVEREVENTRGRIIAAGNDA